MLCQLLRTWNKCSDLYLQPAEYFKGMRRVVEALGHLSYRELVTVRRGWYRGKEWLEGRPEERLSAKRLLHWCHLQ